MTRAFVALVALILVYANGKANADVPWQLIARSDVIVHATPIISESATSELSRHVNDYVSIPLSVQAVHKGDIGQRPITLRYFAGRSYGGPEPEAVAAMGGMDALLFLVRGREGGDTYYFASYVPATLSEASATIESEILAEVERQSDLAQRMAQSLREHPPVMDKRVAKLITGVLKPDTAQGAWTGFLTLDRKAVPALIGRMDDRRAVALPMVSLSIPGAFEGLTHYSPRAVVDLVSIVLCRLTGEDFCDIMNGAPEHERASTVAAWRVWLGHEISPQGRPFDRAVE